ncbi:MAG: TonB family protein [Planctomycetota bacterium]
MRHRERRFVSGRTRRLLYTVFGSTILTLLCFLVLPLIQAITAAPETDTMLRSVDSAALPPPPPPPPDVEEEKPPEPPPKPQEIEAEPQNLDLSQLELALDPGVGGGWTTADFAIKIGGGGTDGGGDDNGLFSIADLDQQPRVVYSHNPQMTPQIRRKAPGTVYIVFIVDEEGRVQNPVVQQSPDPVFDRPALDAIKKWKFEPGKRNGKPVRFPMRQPITFKDK